MLCPRKVFSKNYQAFFFVFVPFAHVFQCQLLYKGRFPVGAKLHDQCTDCFLDTPFPQQT